MGEPARLGESEAAPGFLLLQILSLQGWRVSVTGRDDGEDGVLVTATKLGHRSVAVRGASVADVAVDVVKQATGTPE